MKKLNTAEQKMWSEMLVRLDTLAGEVSSAVENYNSLMVEMEDFVGEILCRMEDYEGERSDKWFESDAAQAFSDWKQEWEFISFEQIDFDSPFDDFQALPLERK